MLSCMRVLQTFQFFITFSFHSIKSSNIVRCLKSIFDWSSLSHPIWPVVIMSARGVRLNFDQIIARDLKLMNSKLAEWIVDIFFQLWILLFKIRQSIFTVGGLLMFSVVILFIFILLVWAFDLFSLLLCGTKNKKSNRERKMNRQGYAISPWTHLDLTLNLTPGRLTARAVFYTQCVLHIKSSDVNLL